MAKALRTVYLMGSALLRLSAIMITVPIYRHIALHTFRSSLRKQGLPRSVVNQLSRVYQQEYLRLTRVTSLVKMVQGR